jgi:hypothetical protein
MRTIACLPFFLASLALADDVADRAAIGRVIAGLNEQPRRAALFTVDSDAPAELERLPKVEPLEFRVRTPEADPALPSGADRPTLTISHEPWGEAAIDFPGRLPVVELVNPRIVGSGIRSITPDVALADGRWTYTEKGGATRTIPLLFVVKKEGETWKLAALRTLAPR